MMKIDGPFVAGYAWNDRMVGIFSLLLRGRLPFFFETTTSMNYFLDFSALGFLIDRKDFCEMDQLKGMFQHPFDLDVSKDEFSQDIPTPSVKIVWKAYRDLNQT